MCFEAVIARLVGAWVTPQPGGIGHGVSGASGGRLCSCYPLTVCSETEGLIHEGFSPTPDSPHSCLRISAEIEQGQTSLVPVDVHGVCS